MGVPGVRMRIGTVATDALTPRQATPNPFKTRIGTVVTDALQRRQDAPSIRTRIGTVVSDAFLQARQSTVETPEGEITEDDLPYGYVIEHGRVVPFWFTKTGFIIKWSIFLGLLTLFSLYLIIGYNHAKRRVRKGLKPLAYHRWLLPRDVLARSDPRYAYPQARYNFAPMPATYGMSAMPPPVYDPNRPPTYEGAMPVGSKIDPSQGATMRPAGGQGDDYAAPPGPPPAAALRPEQTGRPETTNGANNPFSDPPRL